MVIIERLGGLVARTHILKRCGADKTIAQRDWS